MYRPAANTLDSSGCQLSDQRTWSESSTISSISTKHWDPAQLSRLSQPRPAGTEPATLGIAPANTASLPALADWGTRNNTCSSGHKKLIKHTFDQKILSLQARKNKTAV